MKHFKIVFVGRSPPLFKHIEKNYAHKCLSSLNKIEFLEFQVLDFNSPYKSGWQEYKTILALCPNLKKIRLWFKQNDIYIDYEKAFENISKENQDIWQERVIYLNSCGIEIVGREGWDKYIEILLKNMKWGFEFYKYN